MSDNYKRMIQLAEDVFAVKNDPDQLNVNPKVMKRLRKIHPACISEHDDGNGPVAWLLLIPTTSELMNAFLKKTINEIALFKQTPVNGIYDSLYLCSALVLEEYRRKGIIKEMAQKAIQEIRKEHPVKSLFAWPFTKDGYLACDHISILTSLPLFKRSK
jgi:hypothetical protein